VLLVRLIQNSGVVQFLTITFSAIAAFFPDDLDWILEHWGSPGQPSEGLSHWPTDITGDIRPVACHSHNDYWRRVPLYQAIHAGCIGVEADVWLFDEELNVGHNTYSLTPNRTLKSLYINPLLEILEKQNPVTHFQPARETPPHGVFDTDPSQTLVLLIDFKTSGDDLWPYVSSQLEPFRRKGYLTYFNGTDVIEGPITVVGTGNTPFDLLVSNTTYRDIFFDAPLDQMADNTQAFDWHAPQFDGESDNDTYMDSDGDPDPALAPSIQRVPAPSRRSNDAGQGHSGSAPTNPNDYSYLNSYYASVSFKKSIGHVWRYRLSTTQLDLVRAQIRGAHDRGLKVRYWDLPSWPRGLRNHVWHVLVREGVDILNVDDLNGATRRDWRRRKGWWY
jgi:hypothetical protein